MEPHTRNQALLLDIGLQSLVYFPVSTSRSSGHSHMNDFTFLLVIITV